MGAWKKHVQLDSTCLWECVCVGVCVCVCGCALVCVCVWVWMGEGVWATMVMIVRGVHIRLNNVLASGRGLSAKCVSCVSMSRGGMR